MKYFTPAWCAGLHAGPACDALSAYRTYLDSIRSHLTPELLRLETELPLRDSLLTGLTLDTNERVARVSLDTWNEAGDVLKLGLTYLNSRPSP